jgi:transposase
VEQFRDLVVRQVGALPVVAAICERLGVVDIVDDACAIRSVAEYTHGQVALAMVANRLTHPRPLSNFVDWADRFAVAETIGIEPEKLNDDRLGRTLDKLADHVDEVLNAIASRAIEQYGISIGELHWDLTHVAFTGSYGEQDPDHVQVRRGPTPDKKMVRQVKTGLWVTDDGSVPFRGIGFDGATNDVGCVRPALAQLDAIRAKLPAHEPPLVVGDSKLMSHDNARAFISRGMRFVCPHPKDRPTNTMLAEPDDADFKPLAYRPQRQRTAEPRYLAIDTDRSCGEIELRALQVLSLDDRDACRAQRAKQLERARDEIERLNRGVGRHTKTAEQLERKAAAILTKRRVSDILRLTITEAERPQATLRADRHAIDAAERLDGRYMLVTNDREMTPDELFAAYKRQHAIESRFSDYKGPINVRPIFLKSNRRIAALTAIISIALLIYSLIERQVRAQLDTLTKDEQRLLTSRIGRATARKILDQLTDLTAARTRDGPEPYRLTRPRPIQELLLRLLN